MKVKIEVRHIAFLVLPNVMLLDVTGPYEVFTQAIECLSDKEKDSSFTNVYRI